MPGTSRCANPATRSGLTNNLRATTCCAPQHTSANTGASATPTFLCSGHPGAHTSVMGSMGGNVWSTTVLGSPFGPIPVQHPPQPASSLGPASSSTHSYKCGRRCGYTPLGGTRGKPVSVTAVTLRQHPLITGDCNVLVQGHAAAGAAAIPRPSSMARYTGVVLAFEEPL